ncbi:uncharacterized protein N7446_010732 [Penicillium canescens]|uniref:Uncharacterized protein n=1 Tax=Penicillium canescens TaxID=5083 RepID=A0AAD6IBT4_PENCN|nr:uncharacterized protein N7446_010732 [Penicillium canescens]KAJ6041380.1 hypothetical protein N7460_006770 [Penicillium canescens]KAJ6050623.1 hypothetical protein N7446_010732 [Penicillium canescens]KAJ6065846.1 hypothetical protein N7444_001499 [Penicillium canescens]
MKQFDAKTGMFYREQTLGVNTILSPFGDNHELTKDLANLRFLFDSRIDILTCAGDDGCVIAFACQTRCDGEWVKVMQTYAGDVLKALKALHDMSCTRLKEFCTDCGHELHHKHLTQCHIPVPRELQLPLRSNNMALSEDSNVLIDMPLPEEEPEQGKPEILEAEHGHTDVQEESTNTAIPQERSGNLTETALEVSPNNFTPSTSVSSHPPVRGFSILLDIQYPYRRPMGALRYIESPSRQNILQVVAQVLSTSEIPNDPIWPMKSLSVRKGNTVYDVLGHPQDDIGSLLDDILESEKLIKIECVH